MSDILKVTTPTTGYENTSRSNPIQSNDPNIQNIVDPSKVGRPDGKAGYSENQQKQFTLNYESNFEMFLQMVKNTSKLSEIMTDLLFTKMGMLVTSGLHEDFAGEVSKFLEMLKMTDAQVVHFLKNQSAGAVRFKGTFFHVLRQVMEGTQSMGLKTQILDFLKRYNDMASGRHILKGILKNLDSIGRSIPASYRESLENLAQKLSLSAENGDTQANAAILKKEIIPYLSQYVGRTYDMGKAREWITLLTLNIARYENGNKEQFMQSFQQLLGYTGIQEKLKGLDPNQLQQILLNTEFEKAGSQMAMMDHLVSLLEKGMNGEAGFEAKEVFENVIQALLVNESVYMPLLHIMIPAELHGSMLFSELWIDPEDGEEEGSNGEKEKRIKLFLKFDIQHVGYFEMILASCQGNVDLQLFYPKQMESKETEIKSGIRSIMEKNGFTFRSFFLEKSIRPKTISEVFPKLYERKNTINVKI